MTKTWGSFCALGLLTCGLASPAFAQTERAAADLLASLPPAAAIAAGDPLTQVHVRWQAAASPSGEPVRPADMIAVNRFDVVMRSELRGPLVRERDPQLSEDELVVVAADAAGREISWQKVRDPRLLRSEQPAPNGQLSGETFYRPEVELVMILPDPATASLHIYQAHWTGEQFVLRQLGRVDVTTP
jgi:hypothetical protein